MIKIEPIKHPQNKRVTLQVVFLMKMVDGSVHRVVEYNGRLQMLYDNKQLISLSAFDQNCYTLERVNN